MHLHARCRPHRLLTLVFLLTICAVLILAPSVYAQSTGVDSQNKQLRQPTPDEVKILTDGMKSMLNRNADDLKVVKGRFGAEVMDLKGRFMNLEVVKINPDGSLSGECVTTVEQARQFLTEPQQPKPSVKKQAPAALEEK